MAKKRNYLKLQAKPLQNDSNCFLLSDEDDSDDSEIVVPSSQAKRRIFQNPPRQKPRPSLIRRNLNEFVSSTPMHPARKTFNGSLHLSPIENEPPERQVRRNSKSLQMEIIPSTQESSKRKNATKPVKKKDVTKNNSELGNKSVLARPLQSTVSSSEDNTNNNEKEREITRVDTRKTLCTEVQTSFKSPLCRITKSYCNVLTQTAVDKGTQITDSLDGRDSRRSSTRSRTTRQSSTNKNDNPEDDEDDPTLTENTIGRNLRSASEKLQRTPKKDANRTKGQSAERSLTTAVQKNISTGARADVSPTQRIQTNIPTSASTKRGQTDMSITTGGRANGSLGSRANTSIGARANASVAPQPDILFGIRADGSDGARTDISNGDQENISTGDRAGLHQADDVQDHQSNDSQSYAGSEGSWANDGMKAKWLSDLLNGYFGNSKASVTDCSPKEKCATVEQNSVYLRLEREKLIEEMQTSRSTHNRREGDGNATNVNGNNSRKDIVQPAKNSEQKRRKSQKTKECPSEDVNDEVLDNDAPIDESRRHMSSRLSEKVNKNFNEEIPVANRSRQVVHSLRDNTTNNTVTNKSVASNVRHDNHSSTGGELSYDSHAGNADNTRRTNNVVSNKGKRSDYNELSQMEVIENDIFTPVQEDPRRSTKHRKNGRASTGAKQNRKIGKNEEEIGDVSKNLNKTDKKRDLQDAAEPMEDESNQTRSSKRKISSRSSTRSKTAKAKLEAFLLNVANTSPEKLNNSLPKGKRKSEEKLIDEISETFRVPVTPSETFQAPKINVIENRVLTPVDSNENDLKPTPAKKRRGGPKKVIPAIIVAENTDTENSSSDGLRRSTRARKQRTLLYNPQIIFTNAREFLQFSKINTALQASTIAELNKINLDDLRKKKRSTVAREKSLPAKNPRPRTKQKQKQSVETISEEKNNLDLVENNPIESTILEEDNITNPVQLRTAENTGSHLSSSDYVQRDVFYISQGNQESRIDWSFPVAKFNDLGTNKNFRTAVGPKSSQDGFQSGSLEILPGRSKPKDKAAKFVLVFSVVEGTGLFQVHDSYQVLSRGGKCYVPLGIYYSIENQSETERLLLDYVKIKPQHR